MGKRKGRDRRRLADLSVTPPERPRYVPPRHDEVQDFMQDDDESGIRTHLVARYLRERLVDFLGHG